MNEKEKIAIEKLKERVKIDRQLRDKVESDFDKFCEDECIAIETVLNLIDKQNKVIDEIKKLETMLMYDKYEDTYKEVICKNELDGILEKNWEVV